MDTLAADLHQAATDLLDVPRSHGHTLPLPHPASTTGARHGHSDNTTIAPSPQASKSKLILLGADGEPSKDERRDCIAAPSTHNNKAQTQSDWPAGIKASSFHPNAQKDGTQLSDRLASLHCDTPPLREPSSLSCTAFEPVQPSVTTSARSIPLKSPLFHKATASALTGSGFSRMDIWLNERGERVLDGKVIGQLSLARTRLEHTRWIRGVDLNCKSDSKEPCELEPSDASNRISGTRQHSLDALESATPAMRGGTELSNIEFDHSRHGSHARSTTPAFFVQSFPNAVPGHKSGSTSILNPQRNRSQTDLSNDSDDVGDTYHDVGRDINDGPESLPESPGNLPGFIPEEDRESTVKELSVLRLPGILACPPMMGHFRSSLLRLHSATRAPPLTRAGRDISKNDEESAKNGLAEPVASLTLDDAVDVPMKFDETVKGIAREPWKRLAGSTSSTAVESVPTLIDDRPLLERATSLSGEKAWRPSAEPAEGTSDADTSRLSFAHTMPAQLQSISVAPRSNAKLPISGEQSACDPDTASLYSLPASSIAGSVSDTASRRPSLHQRTASNASLLSTSASIHGSPPSSFSPRRPRRPRSMSTEIFTRDVAVRAWSEVGSRPRGYVTFEVVLLTAQSGLTIRAHRRYSSFVALKRQLATEAPHFAADLPGLPPKDLIHRFSAKYLELRRIALTKWLKLVLLDPRWGGRKAAREWLVGAA